MKAETVGGRDIGWLQRVLWPDERQVRVTFDDAPASGFRRFESFAVVPNALRPRLLVPTVPGAGRAGFMQFNNSMSQRARLTKALAGTVFDLGIGRGLVRDRIHVDVRADLEPDHLGAALLERHLGDVMDLPSLVVSVTFGSLRPNRKPVLQVATSAGTVVGYAKIAWNELTRALVRNEAEALRRWGIEPPRTLLVPELLHHGTWHEREIIVTSGFRSPVRRRGHRDAWPPIGIHREVADRDGITRSALGSAPMWRDIRERGSRVADEAARQRLCELADTFERRFGDLDVAIGSWHGDWAPWNMTWIGRRLAIWDWERSRDGVPVGLDPVHFAFQVSLRRAGRRPAEAARRALPLVAPVLSQLGVDAARSVALLALYLFELSLRYEDAAAEGVIGGEDPSRTGILDVLSTTVGGRTR